MKINKYTLICSGVLFLNKFSRLCDILMHVIWDIITQWNFIRKQTKPGANLQSSGLKRTDWDVHSDLWTVDKLIQRISSLPAIIDIRYGLRYGKDALELNLAGEKENSFLFPRGKRKRVAPSPQKNPY